MCGIVDLRRTPNVPQRTRTIPKTRAKACLLDYLLRLTDPQPHKKSNSLRGHRSSTLFCARYVTHRSHSVKEPSPSPDPHAINTTCCLRSYANEDQPERLSLRDLNINYRLQFRFQLSGHQSFSVDFMIELLSTTTNPSPATLDSFADILTLRIRLMNRL